MTLPHKVCKRCGEKISGRSDKKFCNDYCRNVFHNEINASKHTIVKNINQLLGKNRRIMESLLPKQDSTIKLTRENLVRLGFHFSYFTHLYRTKTGNTYYYCYDYGYLPLGDDKYLIVRKNFEGTDFPRSGF
jgi:predicted nucleic acid-binding Zn ribbon protein